MNTTLNEYVTRYYVSWLKYARYLCKLYGLRAEAYDIFSESLLDLLTKSAEVIDGLLACEAQGDKKLLNYTKKIILNHVIRFTQTRCCFPHAGDSYIFNRLANTTADAADDALLDFDEAIYNSSREIEANFRDDSFIEPVPFLDLPVKRKIKVNTSVFIHTPKVRTGKDGTKRVYMPTKGEVYYTEAGARKIKTKFFTTRGAAWAWTRQCKAEILAGVLTL